MNTLRSLPSRVRFSKCTNYAAPWSHNRCNSRDYSAANHTNLKISDVKELQIPMPYGKLAAKAWGNETGRPVLAFHGWLDNCGTFDRLLPLLSNEWYVVAIDAPGHGLSAHKPPGCLYTDLDHIKDYRKVVDFLGWKKFSLIGHSMGGAMAFTFASLFPELIEKLVALDMGKIFSMPQDVFPNVIAQALTDVLKLEAKTLKSPPLYTPETAAVRLREGMHNEIIPEVVEVLLKRGTRLSDCGKGVVFTRDLRCRPIEFISLRSHELVYQYSKAIECEILLIMANNTHPNYKSDEPDTLDKAYEIYGKHAKKFVLEYVEGNHFVHLNNPERVAPIINKFLSS